MQRLLVITLIGFCTGCNSGARIAAANDQLRLERESQHEQIESLEAENAELRSKLAEANARLGSPIPDDVLIALPRVASIELTRFSDLRDDVMTWSIRPSDSRGRFVQVVGTLELRAVTAGSEPRVLAETVLAPAELRDAYASGLSGAAYRASAQITGDIAWPVTLTAVLHDHVTGTSHEASRVMEAR